MMQEGFLAEHHGVKNGLLGDITGNLETARMGLNETYKVALIFSVASAAQAFELNLLQHDAASAGTSKALAISNAYFVKASADSIFTKKEISGVSNIIDADLNGSAGVVIVEVLAEDLDRANNFSHISAEMVSAVARVSSCEMIGYAMRKRPAYEVAL